MTTLLIDGDVLLYRFGFRGEDSADFGDGVVCEWTTPDAVITEMDGFVAQMQKVCNCKRVFMCLSGPSQSIFRYELLSTYKHNRKDAVKPKLYQDIKDYVQENYTVVSKPVLEADDSMGILSTKKPGKYVIASIDKDLVQIPGYHYNWSVDEKPRWIDEVSADKAFYKQVLSGDPVDGFSGVPNIGKKKAEKIINTLFLNYHPMPSEAWDTIMPYYEAKGLSEAYALTQARMARILRFEDWDSETQRPILWDPHSKNQ